MILLRHLLIGALVGSTTLSSANGSVTGRINSWTLWETDSISSTTVAEVYDTSVTPATLIGLAVGPDIAAACSQSNRSCTYRSLSGANGELNLERLVDNNAVTDSIATSSLPFGGSSLLWGLGSSGKAEFTNIKLDWSGSFTSSLLQEKALLGHKKFRNHIRKASVTYLAKQFEFSFGRMPLTNGSTVDGSKITYSTPSHKFGVFAGLSPDPITKSLSKDGLIFGTLWEYSPEIFIADTSVTKFNLETSLNFETYKGDVDRFFVYERARFSPVMSINFYQQLTLDLPWDGPQDRGDMQISHFALDTTWHPNSQWFTSLGFSQFKMDRHLREEALRWVTDNTIQEARVGTSMDQSSRYRLEARLSYKPTYYLQPYVRLRAERRSFQSGTGLTNQGTTNINLVDTKNAYAYRLGLRSFPLEWLETDSSFNQNFRYQSESLDLWHSFIFTLSDPWTIETDIQWVQSRRDAYNSSNVGTEQNTTDWYFGLGTSYEVGADITAEMRYDLACEEDPYLDSSLITHSVYLRGEWRF